MNNLNDNTMLFTVINVQALEAGVSATKIWEVNGGIIGSNTHSTWCLKDSNQTVALSHCQVMFIDGAYCLKELDGSTYLNGSHMPLGKGNKVRLNHNDEILIGRYNIRVDNEGSGEGEVDLFLDTMFKTQGESLLDASLHREESLEPKQEVTPTVDPLKMIQDPNDIEQKQSLLYQADQEDEQEHQSLVPEEVSSTHHQTMTPQADSDFEISSSVRLSNAFKKLWPGKGRKAKHLSTTDPKVIPPQDTQVDIDNKGYQMDAKDLDLLEEEVAQSIQANEQESIAVTDTGNHLLARPMLKGLGADISYKHNMERMGMLSKELGESLQACISGLLDIHQDIQRGRFGIMNRNLQPIEDNPLRLGLSYGETINTLYDSDQSLVHLSAPAAIAESLKNIQAHNEAMQYATNEALIQILNAFSPEVLLRRFKNYRCEHFNQEKSNVDSWAWGMYQNYYQELTSNRQQGFEKLFWEIFEQAYDKKIREKQQEI